MKFDRPFDFDMALLEPVLIMMQKGIRVDQKKKSELSTQYHESWDTAQERLDLVAGGSLNVNSPKQMKDFFYGDLGLPVRVSGGKPTVNEDALRAIMVECRTKMDTLKTEAAKFRWKRGYAAARLALNCRGFRKRISSYIDIKHDVDGRIRSTISIGGTETFRFAHSKTLWDTGLNLATVPRELRSMFIPDDGYVLVEFDLNRGESWIYAHLSQDPELLRIHEEGLDFHAETASAISTAFGEPLSVQWIIENKNDAAYYIRYLGKKINHASAYRMGAFRGAQVVNAEADETGITVTVSQFKAAQALWSQKYIGMQSWWMEIERAANASRSLTSAYGRTCTFYERWGDGLFKEMTAWEPQTTSVDYLNRGMLDVYHRFQSCGAWDMSILTQTHDSILVQMLEEDIDEGIPAITKALHSELTIKGKTFTIPVEAQWGHSWGDLKEYTLPSS